MLATRPPKPLEVEVETIMNSELTGWVHVTHVRFLILCLFMMYDTSVLVNSIGS
jgi:hypothetical protein